MSLPEFDMPDLSSMISDSPTIATKEEINELCNKIKEAEKNNDIGTILEIAKTGLKTVWDFLK
jgi:uncharacterized metal-binding protein